MPKYLCFLLCVCLAGNTVAQKTLEFDESGKLLHKPGNNFRPGSTIRFRINKSGLYLKTVTDFTKAQQEFMHLLNDSTENEKALVSQLQEVDMFFRAIYQWPDVNGTYHDQYIAELCGLNLSESSYKNITPKLNWDDFWSSCQNDTNCLNILCRSQLKKGTDIINRLMDIQQRRKLWKDLLCDFKNDTAYELYKMTYGRNFYPGLVLARKQRALSVLPDKILLGPGYSIDQKGAALVVSGKDTCYQLKAKIKRGAFTLKTVDSFGLQAINWSNKTAGLLNKDIARDLLAHCDNLLVKYKDSVFGFCPSNCDPKRMGTTLKELSTLDSAWCFSSPVGQYLRSWSWYSNGALSLNYLNNGAQLLSDSAYQKKTQELAAVTEKLNKIEIVKKCDSCGLRSLAVLDKLLRVQKGLTAQKTKLAKELSAADDQKKKLETAQATVKVLHVVTLPMKRKRHRQYIYYFDGSDSYDLKSTQDLLPEDRDIFFGVYNNSLPATSISFTNTLVDFNDSGPLQKDLAPALANLATAAAALSGSSAVIGDLVSSAFTGAAHARSLLNKESGQNKTPDQKAQQYCDSLNREIFTRLWRINLLDTLLKQYLASPPVIQPLNAVSKDTSFYTFYQKPGLKAAPFTDSFAVVQTKNKTKLNEGTFSVGRQKIITIGAGFFYDNNAPNQVSVDTAGNSFSATSSDTKIKYVIGLKLYPFKNFDADGGIIPRFPLSRISFFGGFEITKPLENLYVGLGYDLVPGLQLSGGVHYARKDYYKIQNNQVLDKTTHYVTSGPYFGVTIDPAILTSALKLIFNK